MPITAVSIQGTGVLVVVGIGVGVNGSAVMVGTAVGEGGASSRGGVSGFDWVVVVGAAVDSTRVITASGVTGGMFVNWQAMVMVNRSSANRRGYFVLSLSIFK
jgi:hypothetical protein